MFSKYVGLFAFPAAYLNELVALYREWSASVDKLRDDSDLLENDLYRRAQAVAIRQVELNDEEMYAAFLAIDGYLARKVWHSLNQGVFSPTECRALAQGIDDLEKRLGRDRLMRRLMRHGHDVPAEALGKLYDIYKTILGAAVAKEAGFLCAVLRPGAEEALAEARRKQAEEAAARPPEPPDVAETDEERARRRAMLDELIRALSPKPAPGPTGEAFHVDLCVVAADELQALLDLHRQSTEAWQTESWDRALALEDQILALAQDDAEETAHFTPDQDADAIVTLEHLLAADIGPAYRDSGLYSPEQTRTLHRAALRWEQDHGGEHRVCATLGLDIHASGHPSGHPSGNAYQTWKHLVATAAHDGHGLLWKKYTLD